MEVVLVTLTGILGLLSTWSLAVSFDLFRMMSKIKKQRTKIRTEDKIMFSCLMGFSFVSFFVLFIRPGLIYTIPSAAAVIEIIVALLLFHITDKHLKDINQIKKTSFNSY